MQHSDPKYAARLAAYGAMSTHLSLLSDRELGDAVAAAGVLFVESGDLSGARAADTRRVVGRSPGFGDRE